MTDKQFQAILAADTAAIVRYQSIDRMPIADQHRRLLVREVLRLRAIIDDLPMPVLHLQ